MSQMVYKVEQEELLQIIGDKVIRDHPELGFNVRVDIYADKQNGISCFWAEVKAKKEEKQG